MDVRVTGRPISDEEQKAYIDRGIERYGADLIRLEINAVSDEECEIRYILKSRDPFERIRRITGYLVGTLDKWNDAKRSEEHDRVKHRME